MPRLLQILNGLLGETGLSEVIGHQLGLRFDRVAEFRPQGIGNPIVELLALTPHHIGISGILEQRMLEHIG